MEFVEAYNGGKIYKGPSGNDGTIMYRSQDKNGQDIGLLSDTLEEARSKIDRASASYSSSPRTK
jgi:hypothetical protein